ncbi:acyl carrier protein [Streptomyces sp. NPDC055189]
MEQPKFTVERLKEILVEVAGADENVDFDGDILDTDFEALGYESLALLETGGRIESELKITLADDALINATTPRALVDHVNAELVSLTA